ncbi:hypothetical protein OH77DRAFT_1305388 [Trametes cingulata]|nr:hypothetical protein OH77DRAFT_1305388 [Trametes cingulata]
MPSPSLYRHRGCVYDVPLALDDQLSRTNLPVPEEPRAAWGRLQQYLQGSIDCIVGPMPVQHFLDAFLPSRPASLEHEMLSSENAFKEVPSSGAMPSALYDPLITALNKSTNGRSRAPGLVFENASERSEHPHQPGYTEPHICCYTSENVHHVRAAPISSRSELGYAELFMQVQPDVAFDFFVDPPPRATAKQLRSHDFITDVPLGDFRRRIERAWSQHIAFAMEVQARQPRVALFSVSICGSHARLLRWDRSGIIITRFFDIHEQPDLLCEFLSRYSYASNLQRGHDNTIETASPEEEFTFRDAITDYVRDQLGISGDALANAVSEHYLPGHVTAVHVFVGGGTQPEEVPVERYLVCRPVASPLRLLGCATRAHWAVHASTRRLVFLKDTWRRPREREGAVIAELQAAGVRNVPTLVAHGDVQYRFPRPDEALSRHIVQYTATDGYVTKPWACSVAGERNTVVAHIHYRLVLGTVGYGLKRFRGTDELLHATYDGFQAMRDAYSKASRLHRDISVGNIILVKEAPGDVRKGYLIDWEGSSRVDGEGRSLEKCRMGTWSFMSAKVQLEPEKPHVFEDDMESLLYVVFYCGLHHLPHNLGPETLRQLTHEFFDKGYMADGRMRGGLSKFMNRDTRYLSRRVEWADPALQTWLDKVMDLHGPRPRTKELAHLWSDPSHLDDFWSTFLAEHTLVTDNAVNNELAKPEWPLNYCPGSDTSFIIPPQWLSAVAKRKAVDQGHTGTELPVATRTSKRRRTQQHDIQTPLRRSERIRARQASSYTSLQRSRRALSTNASLGKQSRTME